MASPVMASSSATAIGSRLGMRIRPPAPAMRPRFASGMPKVACSAATTRSHESMISKPPARADPLTAAITGLGKSRCVSPAKPPLAPMMSPPSPLLKALRSIPALNAFSPLPVITTTQHSASWVSSSMKPAIAVLTAPLMALRASGRLIVRMSTCPRRSRSTSSAMVLPSLMPPPPTGARAPPRLPNAACDHAGGDGAGPAPPVSTGPAAGSGSGSGPGTAAGPGSGAGVASCTMRAMSSAASIWPRFV